MVSALVVVRARDDEPGARDLPLQERAGHRDVLLEDADQVDRDDGELLTPVAHAHGARPQLVVDARGLAVVPEAREVHGPAAEHGGDRALREPEAEPRARLRIGSRREQRDEKQR
jgi:hypothetical protein